MSISREWIKTVLGILAIGPILLLLLPSIAYAQVEVTSCRVIDSPFVTCIDIQTI